jgi:hypothetical protein
MQYMCVLIVHNDTNDNRGSACMHMHVSKQGTERQVNGRQGERERARNGWDPMQGKMKRKTSRVAIYLFCGSSCRLTHIDTNYFLENNASSSIITSHIDCSLDSANHSFLSLFLLYCSYQENVPVVIKYANYISSWEKAKFVRELNRDTLGRRADKYRERERERESNNTLLRTRWPNFRYFYLQSRSSRQSQVSSSQYTVHDDDVTPSSLRSLTDIYVLIKK